LVAANVVAPPPEWVAVAVNATFVWAFTAKDKHINAISNKHDINFN
jgi:hypothetical protein